MIQNALEGMDLPGYFFVRGLYVVYGWFVCNLCVVCGVWFADGLCVIYLCVVCGLRMVCGCLFVCDFVRFAGWEDFLDFFTK